MQIDTGGQFTQMDSACEDATVPVGGNPVIFDPTSTYEVSDLVVVHPGTQILVTAYNLAENARIVVHGASVGQRPVSNGTACCRTDGPNPTLLNRKSADVLFRSPMRLGGQVWELSPTNDRLLISLPGNYVFVLNDSAYFGDLQVEYQRFPLLPMPDVYYAGAGIPTMPV